MAPRETMPKFNAKKFLKFADEHFGGAVPEQFQAQVKIISERMGHFIQSPDPMIFQSRGKHPLAQLQIKYLDKFHPTKTYWTPKNGAELMKMREAHGTG